MRLFAVILLVAVGEIGISHLAAQGTTAAILGTVTDASGAAIAGATVRVNNTGTGQVQSAITDTAGRFNAPNLSVGEYEVRASREGFSSVLRSGITLTVGSQNVVNFVLAVGTAQQTITVQGDVTQVETTNSTVGALIDQVQMRELPLNGRDVESLIQLSPGVQNYYAGSAAIGTGTGANMREGRDPSISVAGSRPEGVAYLLDDQNLKTFYNRGLGSITGTSLGVDAIGEFETLTNTYSAQFGGNGAVMNSVSKSGTNSFHGSVYEFLRNSDLDARNFFDGSSVPPFQQNQFGGSLGGPIRRDRTFFFGN
ncbi:MAG TPA: TonB-dependent receptor, partial [Deltaproteobacteria bacterium]|nr:TonB-dependent receptor [Deltaproteobacteria bacterium]